MNARDLFKQCNVASFSSWYAICKWLLHFYFLLNRSICLSSLCKYSENKCQPFKTNKRVSEIWNRSFTSVQVQDRVRKDRMWLLVPPWQWQLAWWDLEEVGYARPCSVDTWAHLIILQFFSISCLHVHRLLLPHLQVERMGEKKQLERGEDSVSDVRLWHIYLILSHFPIFFSEEAAWKTIVRDSSAICPSQCQGDKLLAKIFCPFGCKVLVLLVTSTCCICIG